MLLRRPLRTSCLLTVALLLSPIVRAQDPSTPLLHGVVTRPLVSNELEVNGKRVMCTPKTTVGPQYGSQSNCFSATLFVGEPVKVFGVKDRKTHAIRAEQILAFLLPDEHDGVAVIDRVLAGAPPGSLMLRADGYPILIRIAETKMRFVPPLKFVGDVGTNVWVAYHGRQREDGVIVADTAAFVPNIVDDREEKLHEQAEYDPAAVPADSRQGAASKAFLGVKVNEIPPYADAAMQARVQRIGESLVPDYQRRMADTEPGKIDFRFHVIDEPHRRSEYYFSNGIMVVPRQAVERMQNDDQLAQLMASGIAGVLEKQEYRRQPANREMLAAQIAGDAGGFFVPGLGLAALAGNAGVNSRIQRLDGEQRRRVSLTLMHDAGYDLHQAPMTWWLLAGKPSKKLTDVDMPQVSQYLYSLLGSTWRDASWLSVSAKIQEPRPSEAGASPVGAPPMAATSKPVEPMNPAQAAKEAGPGPDASGVYRVGPGVQPPKLIETVPPQFTDDARRHKVSGSCLLNIIIDANGLVQRVNLERSIGSRLPPKQQKYAAALDENAMAAVRQYRFDPAIFKGKPVPVEVNVEINFRIR